MLSGGANWEQEVLALEVVVGWVVHTMRSLGLWMSHQKTDAVFFHDGSQRRPPRIYVNMEGTRVLVGAHINHLSLRIDGTWSFEKYFARMAPRLGAVSSSLGRLLPNLGGPNGPNGYAGFMPAL